MATEELTEGVNYGFIYIAPSEKFPEGRTFISPKFNSRKEVNSWIGKTIREIKGTSEGKLIALKAIFPPVDEKEAAKNYKTLFESVLG